MGRPLDYRVWRKRAVPAAYVGTYADPAGMTACVFADPRSGRALGPLNLRLGERTGWTAPAPRVGAPPASRPGTLGLLELYAIEWEGRRKGPDRETRGVFLRFEEGPETADLEAMAADGLLLGLLGRKRTFDDPGEAERHRWGLLLAGHAPPAPAPRITAALVAGHELAPPGLLQPKLLPRLEGCVEPDPGPFAEGPGDPVRFLRAAGVDAWRSALRLLEGAAEREGIAIGLDARGRLALLADGKVERLRWCSFGNPDVLRFGDRVRLQLQGDRIGWAEAVGRDETAVERLRRTPWASHAGDLSWAPAEAVGIREAVGANPSAEHARRLEKALPGAGTAPERLGALLALAAAYWRAGAFEDAWILLGRMPAILPGTADAAVWRAARLLHRLLEGRHVHDATEEERNELSYVWDGTLGQIVEELGPALAGRCAEALENAGL